MPPAIKMIAAGGEIDPILGLRQFPETITGGDSYQANPTKDASFASLINAVRLDAGSPALKYSAKLDKAAQAHSNDMFANGKLTHTGSTAETATVKLRAIRAGYNPTVIGENIAKGQRNENAVMNAWVKSKPHQANNVNAAFEDFGLARKGTGANTYWTLVLGAE
ncbi:CAP domain-containing protein [Planktotalea sp.]|uniref:CAP domain-containing protein n=1 Tax=Planktotalea sp. TaxID=2029877 RepID=UPI003D6B45D7